MTDVQRETAERIAKRDCPGCGGLGYIPSDGLTHGDVKCEYCAFTEKKLVEAMQAQQVETENTLTTEWARDRYISSLQQAAKTAKHRADDAERQRDEALRCKKMACPYCNPDPLVGPDHERPTVKMRRERDEALALKESPGLREQVQALQAENKRMSLEWQTIDTRAVRAERLAEARLAVLRQIYTRVSASEMDWGAALSAADGGDWEARDPSAALPTLRTAARLLIDISSSLAAVLPDTGDET